MIVAGIDPSFSRTGIAVYDDNKGTLDIRRVCMSPNADKSFEQMYNDVEAQSSAIANTVNQMIDGIQDVYIFTECPPPQGSFAPGLYGLDCMMIHKLHRIMSVVEISRLYPTTLQHIHGKRKYQKSESVELAKDLIALQGIHYDQKFCHDEAEAVIYMFCGLADLGLLSKEVEKHIPQLKDVNIKSL